MLANTTAPLMTIVKVSSRQDHSIQAALPMNDAGDRHHQIVSIAHQARNT